MDTFSLNYHYRLNHYRMNTKTLATWLLVISQLLAACKHEGCPPLSEESRTEVHQVRVEFINEWVGEDGALKKSCLPLCDGVQPHYEMEDCRLFSPPPPGLGEGGAGGASSTGGALLLECVKKAQPCA